MNVKPRSGKAILLFVAVCFSLAEGGAFAAGASGENSAGAIPQERTAVLTSGAATLVLTDSEAPSPSAYSRLTIPIAGSETHHYTVQARPGGILITEAGAARSEGQARLIRPEKGEGDGSFPPARSRLLSPVPCSLSRPLWTLGMTFADAAHGVTVSVVGTTSEGIVVLASVLSVTAAVDKTSGVIPVSVNSSSSVQGGTPPYSYDWDFGDGSAHATASTARHTYLDAGTFHVALTAKDANGATATDSHLVITTVAPLAVSAQTDVNTGLAPLMVNFAAMAVGGVAPYTFTWAYGDGGAGSGATSSHTYTTGGTMTWKATATDAVGVSATTAGTILVVSPVEPPVVTAMKRAPAPTPFTLIVTGSNLQSGIQVAIGNTAWAGVTWKSSTKIKIGQGKALKALVPKGQTTRFTFTNPDGGSTTFDFSW